MKTRSIILAALAFVCSASVATFAQSGAEPAIKVLPSNQKGVIKVLFVYDSDQSVDVKFYSEGELVGADRIKAKTFQKGFTKKYDISNISSTNFKVEVESADVSVIYQILESHGSMSYDPQLLRTTYNHPLTASNRKD